jgi:diguanylate cyclase
MVTLGSASPGGWFKVAFWTGFGTLTCVVVSVAYNWVMFAGMAAEAQWQGLNSAIVLPLVLATPSFFVLMVMLRELGIANGRLDELASFDMLTGCLNRRAFTAAVEKRLAEGRDGALLVIDADRFKAVNDGASHAAGDALLKEVARVLQAGKRRCDFVARIGGDEFALILCDCSIENAEKVARGIIDAIAGIAFEWQGRVWRIGASVGIAALSVATPELPGPLEQADMACYAAKAEGRNRVVVSKAAVRTSLSPEPAPATS